MVEEISLGSTPWRMQVITPHPISTPARPAVLP